MNASNPAQFNRALSELLNNLSSEAAASGPLRKYAAGNALTGILQMVYATVQCTPDMDQQNCTACLNYGRSELGGCCYGRMGCRILRPNCVLRFESNPFYNETAVPLPSPPTTSSPTPSPGNGNNTTRTVIIVIASVVGLLILIIIAICIFKRPKRNKDISIKVESK
ncbi:cysteine-rich receptor-like protein kinase 28 [Gossypium hirsutum]|uniref:Cysteine-rich receptor-like protein kinase 28 n=1 Tax=Gossypium hirsutum TaxID=3635 RepID=A0ABM3ANL2_GOSHI|nr:cysteine-rich receptor-like protein kinase 28 [Gossypium hirsutum]